MALTEVTLRNLKPQSKQYAVSDFDGLSICVDPIGSKYWHFRFSWQGKQPRISLGRYPEISLKEARIKRDEYRTLIANGIDPRVKKRRTIQSEGNEAQITFEMFIPRWVELKFKKLGEDAPDSRNSTRTQIQRYHWLIHDKSDREKGLNPENCANGKGKGNGPLRVKGPTH